VLEALGHFGFRAGQPPVDDAISFLLASQDESGAGPAHGGADELRATYQVLAGLRGAGFDIHSLPVRRAVRWLKESQNEDGGWDKDDSSALHTACALLALIAAGEGGSEEARAGAEFLVGTQLHDGGWGEDLSTDALKYQLDPVCFPLMALSRYLQAAAGYRPSGVGPALVRVDEGHAIRGPKGRSPHVRADGE
jgi:squalene-hopene/tetraprenyl-beta-curcumene cyclase